MALEDGLMPAADFVAWMEQQHLNDTTAARELGVSRPSVIKYRKEGAPRVVALACAALSADLEPEDALRPIARRAPLPDLKLSGFSGPMVGGTGPLPAGGAGGPGGPRKGRG